MPTSNPRPANTYSFEAIGTAWQITTYNGPLGSDAQYAIQTRINQFDADYSRFKADSWLSRASATPGKHRVPADAKPLFDLYHELYRLTDGAMTPLIGQMLNQAGYDANYSLRPGRLTAVPTWGDALDYAFPYITTKLALQLDVGAAGKGYLVDIICKLLVQCGLSDFVVNAGGDLRTVALHDALEIGLENPDNDQEVIGIATLQNKSLCGSAGNRRNWGKYNHIIDPRARQSPTHIKAIWVVADTTLLADALTTALYFTEPSKLQARYAFEHLIMDADNRVMQSPEFPAQLFTA